MLQRQASVSVREFDGRGTRHRTTARKQPISLTTAGGEASRARARAGGVDKASKKTRPNSYAHLLQVHAKNKVERAKTTKAATPIHTPPKELSRSIPILTGARVLVLYPVPAGAGRASELSRGQPE